PTGAAELVTEGWHAMPSTLTTLDTQLQRSVMRRLEALGQRLDRAALRLLHPRARIAEEVGRLQGLDQRLGTAMQRRAESDRLRAEHAATRLRAAAPRLKMEQRVLTALAHRLHQARDHLIARHRQRIESLAASLEHLGPEAVLARGYAIARDQQGRVLRRAAEVAPGAMVSVQLAQGSLDTRVTGHQGG
ncbi:exodeoxyribonuclease VII large subunit, partial [Arthrospira platensis SPKY1]|nr:exodeoxyribonuclease VII large subunit [Arthrospira platensis SPKY1]